MNYAKGIFSLVVAVSVGACGPTILGKRMDKSIVCPSADTSRCVQSSGNTTPIYITKPQRFLPLLPDGKPDYWRYLGREMTQDASQFVNFCGNTTVNPLLEYAQNRATDVIEPPYVGSTFDFTRSAETRIGAEFNVDIDALLDAAGIPTGTPRIEATAALNAALSRLRKSDLTMRGRYSFITLSPSVLASMTAVDAPAELKQCAAYLKSNRTSMISALTGVKVDTLTTSGELVSNTNATLDAQLSDTLTAQQLAKLKAEFSSSVNQKYKVATEPTFQVLSISGYRRL